jgi:hypothetical protein
MSRTYRKLESIYRSPKNQGMRRADEALLADLKDIDWSISKINRIKGRYLRSIYDDIVCASWYEADFENSQEILDLSY